MLIGSGGLPKEKGNVHKEPGRPGRRKGTAGQGKGGRVRNVAAKVYRHGEAVCPDLEYPAGGTEADPIDTLC